MKPIIFSTPMVQAILDGRKTQTRRVIIPQPDRFFEVDDTPGNFHLYDVEWGLGQIYPKYQVGDILWVRETWYYEEHMHDLTEGEPDLASGRYSHRYVYKADNRDYPVNVGVGEHGWKPSIHMPREAARLFLRVKNVRVERLQEITPVEVVAEGMGAHECRECIATYGNPCCQDEESECGLGDEILGDFRELWNSLNAKRGYGWDTNPWVWVIEFEREEVEE